MSEKTRKKCYWGKKTHTDGSTDYRIGTVAFNTTTAQEESLDRWSYLTSLFPKRPLFSLSLLTRLAYLSEDRLESYQGRQTGAYLSKYRIYLCFVFLLWDFCVVCVLWGQVATGWAGRQKTLQKFKFFQTDNQKSENNKWAMKCHIAEEDVELHWGDSGQFI